METPQKLQHMAGVTHQGRNYLVIRAYGERPVVYDMGLCADNDSTHGDPSEVDAASIKDMVQDLFPGAKAEMTWARPTQDLVP